MANRIVHTDNSAATLLIFVVVAGAVYLGMTGKFNQLKQAFTPDSNEGPSTDVGRNARGWSNSDIIDDILSGDVGTTDKPWRGSDVIDDSFV